MQPVKKPFVSRGPFRITPDIGTQIACVIEDEIGEDRPEALLHMGLYFGDEEAVSYLRQHPGKMLNIERNGREAGPACDQRS